MARSTKSTRGVRRRAVAKRGKQRVGGSSARLPRVSATSRKQPVRAPGGARAGAGRRMLYGDEPLDEKISTRLNREQATALYAVCEERRVNPNLFMREAALKRAGLSSLGIGLERAYGTLREGKGLPLPREAGLQLPVKCTASQKRGLASYCESKGFEEGTFMKEAALCEAGLEHLTSAAQLRSKAESLASATLEK